MVKVSLGNKNLVTIDDLSSGEIEAIFSVADEFSSNITGQSELCRGKIMASLFIEPSTRTRLSFEAAMHRLGGSVISVADASASSLSKGESLADMARVVGSYVDIIVVRHPWEGAAKVVADYAGVPVINAGDGGHQHPTQTILDLYTLKKEKHSLKGMKIALWGDLKYGRTIHSLIFALAKFGASILFCPAPGLEVPEHILDKLTTEYGGDVVSFKASGEQTPGGVFPLDAIYNTPTSPHQLAMVPGVNLGIALAQGVDALYVTRLQKERLATPGEAQGAKKYPVVDKKLLNDKAFRKTLVMHPLPRVDELAYDLDADPRSMYFKQAAFGVPVRMALISLILGKKNVSIEEEDAVPGVDYPVHRQDSGITCPNPRCVSVKDTETKYLKPEFKLVRRDPLTLRCVYCEHGFEPKFVASVSKHEGKAESRQYHRSDSRFAHTVKPENLLVFDSEEHAMASGFQPGSDIAEKVGKA